MDYSAENLAETSARHWAESKAATMAGPSAALSGGLWAEKLVDLMENHSAAYSADPKAEH